MDHIQSLVNRYFNLAHSISDHLPEYIDAYFGPKEWIKPVEERKGDTIPVLKVRSEELLHEIREADGLVSRRKKFMLAQVEAMHMVTRILAGEELTLEEKIKGLFDVIPTKTPESEFLEIHNTLDGLLPTGGSVHERMSKNEERLNIHKEEFKSVFEEIILDLQTWTMELFTLPSNERLDLRFVSDKPWSGYSCYQGDGLSTIEVNTDLPISILYAIDFLAHETYPGHHTESSIKEMELIRGQGRDELQIILSLSPFCISHEGIAMHAFDIANRQKSFIDWLDSKIFPLAKLDHLDATRQLAIYKAWSDIRGVRTNAVFMYWVEGDSQERIRDYVIEYSLLPVEYVENFVKKWLPHPIFHLYTFTYLHGYSLLDGLFSRTGAAQYWFGELLKDTYLPSEIEGIGRE